MFAVTNLQKTISDGQWSPCKELPHTGETRKIKILCKSSFILVIQLKR